MPVNTCLNDVFEAGPSSGPKYDELVEVWQAYLDHVDTRIDGIADEDGAAEHEPWALPPGSEGYDQLIPTLPADLLDLVGEDTGDNGLAIRVDDEPVRATPSVTALNETSLHDRLKSHLPISSAFSSLIGLISTKRTNEDIQSELVEILGFEGDGLSLVEELLQPGARDRVSAESGLLGGKKGQYSNGGSGANTPPEQGANGNKYLPSARLTVNAHKGKQQKKKAIDITEMIGSSEDIARRINEQLERPKAMFADEGRRVIEKEVLPHVYTSNSGASASMSMGGRFAMPQGTTREYADTYEEVVVPPTRPVPPRISERAIRINELPPVAKGCFPNYATLNRMQSIVQPVAMNTNENMLVCAPTGAGKTDVAIMAIIRVLASYITSPETSRQVTVDRDAFKIIYVAPMKALAAEITRKFGKRLAWLGIKVRELTGDMQLTRQEIADTQIIVTTPEKWDVVTRKPTGEGELASKVKLLIIDEVHLLNEDRGAVIETIVARTLRQVESSQSLIRIVGLSATLPNYRDVSDFLRVNPYQGLFFFDASFRPVPLEQHFIGVTGKARSPQQTRNLDKVVFDKVAEMVQDGHQVMVFVHARKETVKSAIKIKETSMEEGMTTFFEATDHPKFQFYRKEIGTSRNKEMKELFDAGFGIHHAGMLRSDRNMMEKMFEDQAIKVLVCTSTLAWGVNLPAHAVVIKGTQVYDSSKGAFQDLSVLDVLQIFGRAGRPGYETSGVGYICTSHDKLDHYLYSIMSQHPIESKFIAGTVDSLNAEIALGTIANVQDAIQWLGYTYLFVRMRKEPLVYGMSHDEPRDDPQLGNKRNELIVQAARQLSSAKMIRYDEIHNSFVISDLGRIAAKYYLKYQTIEVFNTLFNPRMKNADLFAMLSQATEFDQIQVRENELDELTAILESDHCPMEVKGGVTNKHGKVNILLQAHISKVFIEDFALVSDSAYVAQNAARIIRALLEIALSRNWANNAILLIDLSKAIEKRMWPYEHPLAQITTLHRDTLHNMKQWADDTEIAELRSMTPAEIGQRIKMNEHHGTAVHNAALTFPTIGVDYALRPLSHDVLQLSVTVTPENEWNAKVSTSAEPFYVWIQDESGLGILQWRQILVRQSTTAITIDFLINFGDAPPNSVTIVTASDRWLGSDNTAVIPLTDLVMPSVPPENTELLDIPYLNISVLGNKALEDSYRRYVTMLNGIQSQAFWSVYHTQNNILISAPVATGKSLLGEMAIWHAFRHEPQAVILVLAPTRDAVSDITARLDSIVPKMGVKVKRCLKGGDIVGLEAGTIAVATPAALLALEPAQLAQVLPTFSLFLFEDLHLMDELYELAITAILTVARPMKTRIVGLAVTLNDPTDLAEWLGVEENLRFSFLPIDRGNPITNQVKSYTIAHSATLLKVMVKPAYDVIKAARGAGVIVFVPSRGACRTVAADMVTQSGTEMDLNGFLGAPRADVEPLIQSKGLRDTALYEPLLHGIGYVSNTMAPQDLALVLELFASGILKTLIAPREACWTLPIRASTVVLMGAQYVRTTAGPGSGQAERDRQVVDYSRAELVRMQGFASMSASPLGNAVYGNGNGEVNGDGAGGKVFILCQAEQAASIPRILNDGLPLESNLPALLSKDRSAISSVAIAALERLLSAKHRELPPRPQINRPRMPDQRKADLMDVLNWTYLAKRTRSNPSYYALHNGYEVDGVSRMVDKWFEGNEYREDVKGRDDEGDVKGKGKGKGRQVEADGQAPTVSNGAPGLGAAAEQAISGTEPGKTEVNDA